MARVIEIARKRTRSFYTFEEHIKRFRTYVRDRSDTVPEYTGHFVSLWRRASESERGVLDFEASFRLAYGLPPCWRRRALQVLDDTVDRDPDIMAEIGDFPRYCSMILRIWALYRGCPPVDVAAPSCSPGPPDSAVQQGVDVDAGIHVPSFILHIGTHDAEAGPSGMQADQTDGSVPPRAQDDQGRRCGMMEEDTDDEDTDEEDPVEDEIVDLTGD
ncbi:hypothetical protein C2S53_019851 [Perilla frutescens var. hirtella]|uniref:Uncharacterized protein n=1 Tax=Perilla frutescens var. hirtella TaxID=608512 RepID=A0AAD4NWC2_PERFH|nr:hypothetical protein C2S53_019851 [Perilla frutescens var. hirtella]